MTDASYSPALRARLLVRRARALRSMPARAALFHLRVYVRALRRGDTFSLRSGTPPRHVAELLRLAGGRLRVVELGTATGWTTGALVVDEPLRVVLSFDPVERPEREAYLEVLTPAQRDRVVLIGQAGVDGARDARAPDDVDVLFIDSSHERDATREEFLAWRDRIVPGGIAVFHDHDNPDYPGVAAAVAELGLDGEVRSGMFVWRAPG